MGKEISKFSQKICTKPLNSKVLILGPEGTGKTTLFDRLKSNEVYITNPTIGFNVEQIKVDFQPVTLWDFGGHEKIMHLWDKYFDNTDLVILVIDSTDSQNAEKLKEILNLISNKLKGVYVVLLINKIDLPDSQSTEEIIKCIDLYKYTLKIAKIIRTSTVRGDGMKEVVKTITSSLSRVASGYN